MRYEDLLGIVGRWPTFETGSLLIGRWDPADVRRQLSRWVATGRVLQLRRGLYALAPPYRRVEPHPFHVANQLILGSYVSLQAALAHYGMIPEATFSVTSVTHRRARDFDTPLGRFIFRNVKQDLFAGYVAVELGPGVTYHIATPEKALADLIHVTPHGDDPGYLAELRLNLSRFRWRAFAGWAAHSERVKRALPHVRALLRAEADFKELA